MGTVQFKTDEFIKWLVDKKICKNTHSAECYVSYLRLAAKEELTHTKVNKLINALGKYQTFLKETLV